MDHTTFDPEVYWELYKNKSHNELIGELIKLQEKINQVYLEKLQLRIDYILVKPRTKRGQIPFIP